MYRQVIVLLYLLVISSTTESAVTPTVALGEDWSLPAGVTVVPNSGFYSEAATPAVNINVKSFDVAWKQVNPSKDVYATNIAATIKEMPFGTFASQNSTTSPFWLRIWNSGSTWAPSWIQSYCQVTASVQDYDNEYHLPIWNPCVWGELKKMYRHFFVTMNMRADPRMKFVQVPGAFNWCEFDFDVVGKYIAKGLTYQVFDTWFRTMVDDLVYMFNGENNDPSDDFAYKLIYTGEDYPFDIDQWPASKNLWATYAVSKGMGIRTGITEISNFHLSHIPAYGVKVDANGYMVLNKTWPLQANPKRVIATENECFNACGYTTASNVLAYAVKMSNLKALQMGVNWLYLVDNDSYIRTYPDLYNWVRFNLGRWPNNSFEAWAALRQAQDNFDYGFSWKGAPYIKNYERFLTQRDVAGAITQRGTTKYTNVVKEEGGSNNGIAYEGLQTNVANGNTSIVFYLDDEFITPVTPSGPVKIKVVFLDNRATSWVLSYVNSAGATVLTDPVVQAGSSGNLTTATFTIPDAHFKNTVQPGNADFKLVVTGTNNVEIWFIRVIKQ
ncbi:hypothetical protein SAMD00019534_041340 [Acytostelium subglobosum LB1]|uniref:hypothetical protein n=1 Tax=Acytostelium subglobosum LB1 TaxID=1410327 RepID=UPI0006451FDA|nr:hypothetical protein SAMD00019534_041340 [Acytostelium subglobosum LB1]GAM20959.1 hypothetical protein SAMD00019534_041340 [Acytostelium subglobosum LB1]|eukprot:XP_012756093.1 hypothetical protein SAMD00019534_041340 [Acytostelium subglobosum LB1]